MSRFIVSIVGQGGGAVEADNEVHAIMNFTNVHIDVAQSDAGNIFVTNTATGQMTKWLAAQKLPVNRQVAIDAGIIPDDKGNFHKPSSVLRVY